MEKPEGMEKINHKRDWQLFPKHFSISMWLWWKCTWISCAFLAKASGKMQRWRRLISQLTQTAPHEWGRAVWILLPLVNRSFYTTLFLERTLDFPLAQQFGKELDMEGWGGGLPSFEEEEEKLLHTLEKDCWSGLEKCVNCPIANSLNVQINQLFYFSV